MSKEKDAIKKLYSDLSSTDRDEIRKFMEGYENKSYIERTTVNEDLKRILNKSFSSGPLATSGSCPVCGK